jgi:AcrR family transcriptional regulator
MGPTTPGRMKTSPKKRKLCSVAMARCAPTRSIDLSQGRTYVPKQSSHTNQLFGSKQEMLAACISERAKRLQVPTDLSQLLDRETLARTLAALGTQLLREITDPSVVAVFRLAIAEAVSAPEVAWALDSIGRETSRAALREVLTRAQSTGLLSGHPAEMAEQFAGLLWGTWQISLLLRSLIDRPTRRLRGALTMPQPLS